MSNPAAVRRQLNIKTGVVSRLFREHGSYRKEVEDQQKKVEQFVAENAEAWDIKNGNAMLEEAKKMVIDTSERLGKATLELRDLVALVKPDPELSSSEELIKAEEVLGNTSI